MTREPKTVAIKLTSQGERHVKNDHPWVFTDSIEKIDEDIQPGDKAIIFDRKKNKFIAFGLIDPDSPIRIKVLQPRGRINLNQEYFIEKLQTCYDVRKDLWKTTDAFRWVFGENNGLPSLIIDQYSKVVVIKLYSRIWIPYLDLIVEAIKNVVNPKAIVLRLSRQVQVLETPTNIEDGEIIYGELNNPVVNFQEGGVQFSANVIHGHKTGYFLDHRQNRIQVGRLAKGKSVLDVFSYAGGFSVHALANGATKVVSVDISGPALELAKENAALNPQIKGVHETRKGDAFEILERAIEKGEVFDIVVIDPPSFAKSKKEISTALHQYKRLAKLGMRLVAPNGILMLASCSSRVSAEEFFKVCTEEIGKQFQEIDRTAHDIDHPIGFPEGAYLKSIYFKKK